MYQIINITFVFFVGFGPIDAQKFEIDIIDFIVNLFLIFFQHFIYKH